MRSRLPTPKRYTLFTPPSDTHPYASFGHLSSYSSAYYTYVWDSVIAQDFFGQFNHEQSAVRVMRRCVIGRVVLEPGGSMSANDLVKNFLGRPAEHGGVPDDGWGKNSRPRLKSSPAN